MNLNTDRGCKKRTRRNSLDLSVDILAEILLRLPFDSILYFSMKYKGYTNSMSLFNDHNRILCLRIRHDKNKQLTKAGNPRFTVHRLPIDFDENNRVPYFNYTHLSNGIVCYFKYDGVFNFFNLMTGSPALHSVTNSPLPNPLSHHWKHYGFGYDAYGDDYKIVQFWADETDQYWVYSFKNQEWESFNGFPYSAYAAPSFDWSAHSGATTMNGVLHWLVPHKRVIVTYDLHTGVFGEIVLPGVTVGNGLDNCCCFGLQELNGKLCYTYKRRETYHEGLMFDVWRMVGDSWEMLVSIGCVKVDENMSWGIVDTLERLLMLYECSDGRRLILVMDDSRPIPALHWYDFINNAGEPFLPKVWRQQRIQKRARAIVLRDLPADLLTDILLRDLPGEIIAEILQRLPFDSILNCKLVSKEWKNLINHTSFSMKYKGFTNSMALFTDFWGVYCVRILHDDKNKQLTEAGNPVFTVHKLPIISAEEESYFIYAPQIINGIVCVKNNIGVYRFYDLVTGSTPFHTLDDSPVPSPKFPCVWKYFGFGYDAYDHDYKIVQFCHHSSKQTTSNGEIIEAPSIAAVADNTHFWVYSFNNQEWKSFKGCPYYGYSTEIYWGELSVATTLNGLLHWAAPHKGVIITYDMHTRVFGEIVLPSAGVNECFDFGLRELNGKLCYTYKRECDDQFHPSSMSFQIAPHKGVIFTYDVWRMVGDSWEMLVSIDWGGSTPGSDYSQLSPNYQRPLMLHEFEDGQRVVLFLSQVIALLYWYDLVNNNLEMFYRKVWQKIKKRRGRRVKLKTSLVVKN